MYLATCLSICLSVSLSVCLSIYLSIHVYIRYCRQIFSSVRNEMATCCFRSCDKGGLVNDTTGKVDVRGFQVEPDETEELKVVIDSSQQRPTRQVFVDKIQVNPIHTMLKYGICYDFTDRSLCIS